MTTPQSLYFVLEYCPGGDLLYHLTKKTKFSEDEAKFYAGELILALEYIHNTNIIYRDLKPENILLDEKGHIRLADFGLSKENVAGDEIATSFCGSPAYLSPEMLQKKGAIIYEMIVGKPAFFSESIQKMYKKIEEDELEFPKFVSETAKSLIKKLMDKEPNNRPGVLDKSEIKNDPFFKGIDFDAMYNKKYLPPPIEIEEVMKNIQEFADENGVIDFDYQPENKTLNRLKNFTFIENK